MDDEPKLLLRKTMPRASTRMVTYYKSTKRMIGTATYLLLFLLLLFSRGRWSGLDSWLWCQRWNRIECGRKRSWRKGWYKSWSRGGGLHSRCWQWIRSCNSKLNRYARPSRNSRQVYGSDNNSQRYVVSIRRRDSEHATTAKLCQKVRGCRFTARNSRSHKDLIHSLLCSRVASNFPIEMDIVIRTRNAQSDYHTI